MYYQTNYTYALPTVEPSNQKQELESTRQCRCHKPHSLRTSLWTTQTAQLALPSCPASGAASHRQRQLLPVHSPSVQGASSSPVFLPLHREQHAQMPVAYLCTQAAHKHTDMQASSTSNEAVLGLQHSVLIPLTATAASKTQGLLISLALTDLQKCKFAFPNCSPNSKHVSSHKPRYEQGHSFRPLKFPLLPNKSYISEVSPLQPNLHLYLPAPLVPGYSLPQEVLMHSIFSPSAVKQMLRSWQ